MLATARGVPVLERPALERLLMSRCTGVSDLAGETEEFLDPSESNCCSARRAECDWNNPRSLGSTWFWFPLDLLVVNGLLPK